MPMESESATASSGWPKRGRTNGIVAGASRLVTVPFSIRMAAKRSSSRSPPQRSSSLARAPSARHAISSRNPLDHSRTDSSASAIVSVERAPREPSLPGLLLAGCDLRGVGAEELRPDDREDLVAGSPGTDEADAARRVVEEESDHRPLRILHRAGEWRHVICVCSDPVPGLGAAGRPSARVNAAQTGLLGRRGDSAPAVGLHELGFAILSKRLYYEGATAHPTAPERFGGASAR